MIIRQGSKRRLFFVLMIALGLIGCQESHDVIIEESPEKKKIYLTDLMQDAQFRIQGTYQEALRKNPKFLQYPISKYDRPNSIFHHPLGMRQNSLAFHNILVTPHTQLQFSIGIFIEDHPSDGVIFRIELQENDTQRIIFENMVTQFNIWQDHVVDLSSYSRKNVSITLMTEAGKHGDYDWALWGSPKISLYPDEYVLKKSTSARSHRAIITSYKDRKLSHGENRVDRGWLADAITTDIMLSNVHMNTVLRNEIYVLTKVSEQSEELTIELLDDKENTFSSTTYTLTDQHQLITHKYPIHEYSSLLSKVRIRRAANNPSQIFIKEPVQANVLDEQRETPQNHILLISLDTLRADRLGCYGYTKNISPHLDALAQESFLFTNAYSNSNWTLPAHTSMFTSLYPSHHQISLKILKNYQHLAYESPYYYMTEAFKQANYVTLAFTGGGFVDSRYGFNKGFDYHIENVKELNPTSLDLLLELIKTHQDNPQFVFFHTYEIHDFYQNKSIHHHYIPNHADSTLDQTLLDRIYFMADNDEFGKASFQKNHQDGLSPKEVQYLRDLYDGAIVYTDMLLGQFFDELKNLDMYDQSWIIVTSDHGEGLGESHNNNLTRSWYHGPRLYDNQIKIPLIIKPPKHRMQALSSDRRISRFVQIVDLAPTLLAIIGVTAPDQFQGNSLLPLLTRSAPLPEADIFAASLKRYHFSMIKDNYKLLMTVYIPSPSDTPSFRYELYNLSDDPHERVNLLKTDKAAKYAAIYNELQQALWEHNAPFIEQKYQTIKPQIQATPEIEGIDAEHLQRLKELGYL